MYVDENKTFFYFVFSVVNGFVFVGRYLENGFSFSRFSTPQAVLFTLLYKLSMQISSRTNLQSARGVPSLLETRRWGKMLLNTVNNHQLVSESSKTFVSECVDATLGTRGVFSRAAD